MNRLALRMLFGDHAKYLMLISGITFATILMAQGASLFCGLMSWTFAPLRNINVPVWVADPRVEQINDNKPLRDTEVNRVRSVEGVAWAVPLYQGNNQALLPNGESKLITLVGLDSGTLIGAPVTLVAGQLEDLRLPNTVIIDEYGVKKLSRDPANPIKVGDVFEINDREARVVGICKSKMSFSGNPYLFTTYDQAMLYAPNQRKMLSCVIAAANPGEDAATVARRVSAATGLKAYTKSEFFWQSIWWYIKNTGIPVAFGATVLLGFVVGLAISSQTFYSFVLENLRNLGALKAMGASDSVLARMVMLQTFTVGLIGYGCGVGLATLFGLVVLKKGMPPFFMPWQLPLITLVAILFICWLAASLGIRKIKSLEPAIVFRG